MSLTSRRYSSLEDKFIKGLIHNDVGVVKECLELGVLVELKIHNSKYPITYSYQSSLEILQQVLVGYKYPIHVAAEKGNVEILKLLVKYNANVNIASSDRSTALILAAYSNRKNAVRFLLEQGADPNKPLKDGSIALHSAAYKGNIEVLRDLLKYNSFIDTQDDTKETPLISALYKKQERAAEILIQSGADVNIPNSNGATPLFFACQNGYYQIAKQILDKKVNPSTWRKSDKTSPLQIAAIKGHLSVVKLLVESGCDIHHRDDDGLTAEEWASMENNTSVEMYLRTAKCDERFFTEKAKGLFNEKKFQEAMIYFIKSIKPNKPETHPQIYLNIAHCFFSMKNYQQAIANYTKVIQGNPLEKSAYEWRAKCHRMLAEDESNYEKKLEFLNAAAKDEEEFLQKTIL